MKKTLIVIGIMLILIGCAERAAESTVYIEQIANLSPSTCIDCNILFIVVDTLRADHLGTYGYYRNTSPNLDEFAKENILFTNFFTVVPKTGPSMTTFFTGKYVHNHGVTANVKINPDDFLLAEILPDSYRKRAVVANGVLSIEKGFSSGFHNYTIKGLNAEAMTNNAIEWLEKTDQQFFLWLHYLDPHGPFTPPPRLKNLFINDSHYDPTKKVRLDYTKEELTGENPNYVLGAVPEYQRLGDIDEVDYYISQYDAEIYFTDEQIGRLLDYLKTKNLTDNTIIIITADHGESLGEHNYYFEHGMFVNEGNIHIPLIIHHPKIQEPLIIDSLAQNTDILPTILTQTGIKKELNIDGKDLTPLFQKNNQNKTIRKHIYSRTPAKYYTFYETIRTKTGKLIRSGDDTYSYYDLINDPLETKDIFNETDNIQELMDTINQVGETRKGKTV